ncbi:MAG: hypothetical protein ACQESK_06495 [Bacteroidota bacterium]
MSASENFIKRWKEKRKGGFWKYARIEGLKFGIIFFIFQEILMTFTSDESVEIDMNYFIIALLFIAVSGFLYALITWFINEYIYKLKK